MNLKNLSGVEKQLAIKTNVVQRLRKEFVYYCKELDKSEEILAKLKEDEAQKGKITRAEQGVEETRTVKNDIKAKVIKAKDELEHLVSEVEEEATKSSEAYTIATQMLKTVENFINETLLNN